MCEKLVSIIIPVYNVKDFLVDCLDSVINQSYKNLDIVLVDDGSTDGSGNICDEYARQDKRVRVIHQVNQGLSAARNSGIETMRGEYVYFLDSDDRIAKDSIEVLFNLMTTHNAEIAISYLARFSDHTPFFEKSIDGNKLVDCKKALEKMLLNEGIGHEACGKLFKACLWKEYRFPVGKLYEDYATIYYVIAQAKKIAICEYPCYFYRVRSGSIMHSKVREKNFELLDISDEVTEFLIRQYPTLKEPAIRLNMITYLKILKMILDRDMNAYILVQQRIMAHIQKYKSIFLNYKKVSLVDRIKVYALMLGKCTFYYVYRIGDHINTMKLNCQCKNK